jgi:addiction module HigA family antidote
VEPAVNKIEKLQREILGLAREELAAFRKWFREHDETAWDREIEEDAREGRLDRLVEEAREEHRKGRSKPLRDTVLLPAAEPAAGALARGEAPRPACRLDAVARRSQLGESSMPRVPKHRVPSHPGEILLEEFLLPMGLTRRRVAEAIHLPYSRISRLVSQRRGITPGEALRLAKFLGTSPDFWVNLQQRWDLWRARKDEAAELRSIRRHKDAG